MKRSLDMTARVSSHIRFTYATKGSFNDTGHGAKHQKMPGIQLTRKGGKRGHGPGGRLGHLLRIGNGHVGTGGDGQSPSASGRCRRLLRRRRRPRRRLVQRRHLLRLLIMTIFARIDHGYNRQRGIVGSVVQQASERCSI